MVFAFERGIHSDITTNILESMGFDADSASLAAGANSETDIFEFYNSSAHADNNQLAGASERLRNKRREVGESLNICRRGQALKRFGQALHTVQDIYSHSNSIDNGIGIPDILNMANGTAPCALPDFAPTGLVTGYFSSLGFITGNQCRFMGPNLCCHYDLNKDSPTKPNGARHPAARAAAEAATSNYLNLVETDIRARFGSRADQLLKIFKKNQRQTVFVIDDTGSMSGDISGVQATVNDFLNQILAGNESPALGLVTFKDNVTDRGLTCDVEQLRSQVNSLFADGGDDCPEASMSAVMSALQSFPESGSRTQLQGGRVLLATDASSGDASLGPQVVVEAIARGVSVDSILTGDCAAEGSFAALRSAADPTAPSSNGGSSLAAATLQTAAVTSDPLTSGSARTLLRALTEQTGGVLFNVSRVEVDDVVPTLLELGQVDSAILLTRRITLAAGAPLTLDIPVDDTLGSRVTFMVTASTASQLPTLSVQRPGGAPLSSSDPDVAYRALSSVASYAVATPATGFWRVRLEGEGSFVFRAFGATPLRINGLSLETSEQQPPRPESETTPIEGQPLIGSSVLADLRFTEAPRGLAVAVRRADGSLIQDLAPRPLTDARQFRLDLRIPGEPFLIEATGQTPNGSSFIRQVAVPVNPQPVALHANPPANAGAPGLPVTFDLTVSNVAARAATYRFQTSSALGWTVVPLPPVTVGAGATASLTLTVNVPGTAGQDDINKVLVVVEDVDSPRIRNSASVVVGVAEGSNRAPVCDGARPSAAQLWPPDHRMVDIGIANVTDPDGDAVTLTVDAITQDEAVAEAGSGSTAPDGAGVGTAAAQVRAERSGDGDGRVYAIQFHARDGRGGSCAGTVRVSVPHDQNQPAADSGQAFDSTAAPH
ncbi:MAG: hypothetical protein ABIS20_22550 [Thermoanaerobaculia bacterium]